MTTVLSEKALKAAAPRDRAYRITGERGLFAEVRPTGRIFFRVRYWYKNRDSLATLGEWPYLTLKEAREKTDDIRRQLANGIDPAAVSRIDRMEEREELPTFAVISGEWIERKIPEWKSEKGTYASKMRIEKYVLPHIGHLVPDDITAPTILNEVIRPLEVAGKISTAHRVLSLCSQIFRFAVASGRATRDPCGDLRGSLMALPKGHFASMTSPNEFGALLRSIDAYAGSEITRSALQLLALTFVRPGELRHAEWTEIQGSDWKIPAEKMKMKRVHIVPLAPQALQVLSRMRQVTGHMKYIFPSIRSYTGTRPMSDNTLNAALRYMGYSKEQMTAHGFRHAASTMLYESGKWNSDTIERQLAHVDSSVKGVYNYAQHINERREMMNWWANYCDDIRISTI